MAAYYNEFDPYAAQWLRNLIAAGHIAPGDVDERSITDVHPDDLRGYTQCHFFAGIAGWSHALRLAGWPDDRPVWTGSAPCQPFSNAGRRLGLADQRHLWPAFHHLIRECRPAVVFGEQVDAAIRHGWLDLVQDDLEGIGYAVGEVGLPAAGVGAPHRRQRLWFVADALRKGREVRIPSDVPGAGRGCEGREPGKPVPFSTCDWLPCRDGKARPVVEAGESGGVEFPDEQRRERGQEAAPRHEHDGAAPERAQGEHGLGLAGAHRISQDRAGPTNGHWRDADWLLCRDGRGRPVEPGTFPLAHGVPGRVGRLRAYGNAIVPQVAAEVIRAYMEHEAEAFIREIT